MMRAGLVVDSNRPQVDRRRGAPPHTCICHWQRVRRRRGAVVGDGPNRGSPSAMHAKQNPLLAVWRPPWIASRPLGDAPTARTAATGSSSPPIRRSTPWRRRTRERSEGHARPEPPPRSPSIPGPFVATPGSSGAAASLDRVEGHNHSSRTLVPTGGWRAVRTCGRDVQIESRRVRNRSASGSGRRRRDRAWRCYEATHEAFRGPGPTGHRRGDSSSLRQPLGGGPGRGVRPAAHRASQHRAVARSTAEADGGPPDLSTDRNSGDEVVASS